LVTRADKPAEMPVGAAVRRSARHRLRPVREGRDGRQLGRLRGDTVNLTLQFVSWDIEFRGNSAFTFYFSDDEFARPLDDGLVE
jgi:hypothetical protein